jgi:hypothetical protein
MDKNSNGAFFGRQALFIPSYSPCIFVFPNRPSPRDFFARFSYSGGKGKLIRRGGSGKRNGYVSLKFSFAKELTSIVTPFFPS